MSGAFDNVSLLPWQSTILTWVGGATFVLFFSMIPMLFLRSQKKRVENKIHTVFCFMFGSFLLALGISTVTAISFLVDVELGWKLSLLSGASVVFGAVSIIAMLYGSFTGMGMRNFFIWMFLSMLSFASVINLVMMSVKKAQGQSKERAIGYSAKELGKNNYYTFIE